MVGKGGKGLQATKTTAAKSTDKDKDKKKAPVSRSFRAGLQVPSYFLFSPLLSGSSLPCLALF
jgi:histone H2A